VCGYYSITTELRSADQVDKWTIFSMAAKRSRMKMYIPYLLDC